MKTPATHSFMKSGFLATLITFLLVMATHGQVVFSLNKTSYIPGEAITATWSGRTTPSVTDWVGIYRNPNPGGNPDGNPASTTWNYTSSGTRTAGGTALAAGSIAMSNPGVGNWTAYYLANDGYSILGTFNFTVANPAFTFTLNKSAYLSGESITASWQNRSPADANDTLAIYPQGVAPGSGPAASLWSFVSGTQTPGAALASGSVTFASPALANGNWTAHFLGGGITNLGSVNFTITAPAINFALDKSSYAVGETITATWSGRNTPSATDWVGIYPRNVVPGSVSSTIWQYTPGTQAGSVSFTSPGLSTGNWTAFFLADDGYEVLGTFEFTIANNPRIRGFTADHAFINDGTPITLSWVVDPGDGSIQTLTLNDGSTVTNVLGLDVLEVSPLQNTTYTLTLNGSVSAQARVFRDGGNNNAFSLNALHLTTGGGFNAAWNGTSGNPDSWVGIYRAGDQLGPDAAAYWNYLNGTKISGGPNLPNGSLAFTPAKGDYYAVLFSNSGYTIEQGPIRFTVIDEEILPFAVSNFGSDGGDMRLDWNSLPGENYDVLSSTNLIDWQPEAEGIRASATSSSIFMAPIPNDPKRFFRVSHRPKFAP